MQCPCKAAHWHADARPDYCQVGAGPALLASASKMKSTPSSKIDPWFIAQHRTSIVSDWKGQGARATACLRRPGKLPQAEICMGFSDKRLGTHVDQIEPRRPCATQAARPSNVRPVFKRIDTCAAEFASPTAYMYSTYARHPLPARPADEAQGPRDREQGCHPRRRTEPDRSGHRVRLLLLPCLFCAERCGL